VASSYTQSLRATSLVGTTHSPNTASGQRAFRYVSARDIDHGFVGESELGTAWGLDKGQWHFERLV
jgi:hypothetical protein